MSETKTGKVEKDKDPRIDQRQMLDVGMRQQISHFIGQVFSSKKKMADILTVGKDIGVILSIKNF